MMKKTQQRVGYFVFESNRFFTFFVDVCRKILKVFKRAASKKRLWSIGLTEKNC